MANHISVEITATKLTTHTPENADYDYLSYIHGQIEQKMVDLGFHNVKIQVRVI